MVCESIKALAAHHQEWGVDYDYNFKTNEFEHKNALHGEKAMVKNWFKV